MKKKTGSLLELESRQIICSLGLILIIVRIRFFRASYFGQVVKTNLVCANRTRLVVVRIGRGGATRAICLLARGILQLFG